MEIRHRNKPLEEKIPHVPLHPDERPLHPQTWRCLINWKLWIVLLIYWASAIHYLERTRVTNAMRACDWGTWENWTGDKADVKPHRVALIADPQLVDDHTYPTLPRWAGELLRKMSDNYLFINHKYMQSLLDPDSTIFMGDLFDGGRDWEDSAWVREYERFNKIFPERPDKRSYRGLPGNHDIGFQNISTAQMQRFAAHFGQANDYYILGNHTFIQLDTISMSHEDPVIHSQARSFFQTCQEKLDPNMPRIVLTHVPLYRDPMVETCAAGRESKRPFPLQKGFQYQTVIDFTYTEPILKQLKPSLVLSGDDHDVCDMIHLDYSDNKIQLAREISCKTASMTNGIRYPAFHLLSLNNPGGVSPGYNPSLMTATIQTKMCLLPHPYLPLKIYVASLLVCYTLIYVSASRAIHRWRRNGSDFGSQRAMPAKKAAVSLQCAALSIIFLVLWLKQNQM